MAKKKQPELRVTEPTAAQRKVLKIIVGSIAKVGYPPTIAEMQKKTGINTARGVVVHLEALERKGFIKRIPRTARAIQVLKQ